jgi:hypothetical protein
MGSEIEQLPDLAGYLKLASSPAWLRVRLPPAAQPRRDLPVASRPAGSSVTDLSGVRSAQLGGPEPAQEGFEPDPW